MRRILSILAMCCALSVESSAQFAVFDPAITARNASTSLVKEYLLNTERLQHRQLQRMVERLSLLTSLSKYVVDAPPQWRTHSGDFLFTQAYNRALAFGDPAGAAFLAASHPLVDAQGFLAALTPAARRVITSRLATVNVTDAAAIAATNDTGLIRRNGQQRERTAIDALEAHVIDSSAEQSATAALDKISGAVLIAARQRQARVQLLAGVVEQLLIDTKRARDADVAALNMQLVNWRDGRAANDAFVAGSGDALRTWRQP